MTAGPNATPARHLGKGCQRNWHAVCVHALGHSELRRLCRRAPPISVHFGRGMNPGTPLSTTALNLTFALIRSRMSRIASSGSSETSKFSWIRCGLVEVVRRCLAARPRRELLAPATCARARR
jgi:hypothetical protein